MNDPSRRSEWIGSLVLGLLGFFLVAVIVLPLHPCRFCAKERREIRDWLSEPYLRTYLKEHPEEVDAAHAALLRIDERCRSCVHGRVNFWDAQVWSNY